MSTGIWELLSHECEQFNCKRGRGFCSNLHKHPTVSNEFTCILTTIICIFLHVGDRELIGW
jgi:hypothetical protein